MGGSFIKGLSVGVSFRDAVTTDHGALWNLFYRLLYLGDKPLKSLAQLDQFSVFARDNFPAEVAEKMIAVDARHWRHGSGRYRWTAAGTRQFRDDIKAVLDSLD